MKNWEIKANSKIQNSKQKLLKVLLENRGLLTKQQQEEFFNPPPPWTQRITDQLKIDKRQLLKTIERIKQAISQREPIIIYGDYDADGICATAILWEALHALNAKVMPFIPSREEHGYGLSKKGIDEIINHFSKEKFNNEAVKLIITVDNGIVAHKAISYAKAKGIEVLVTDHHQKKIKNNKEDLPKAYAVIWSDKVSGAGVAWVLARVLSKHLKNQVLQGKEGLDLVAIGTIADMMPLLGVNRAFVRYGLRELNQTQRPGLQALFKEAGLIKGGIESWHVGYIIAPRLNAMGRIETAWDSLRLLCTKKETKALKLAEILGATNRERQLLTFETLEHAKENSKIKKESSKIIFIAHESYNQGVIGLVAGKLVEEFYRPAIVISKGKVYSKASVRSVNGFNIIEYLRQFEDIYEDLGGHPMAAGFTIKTEKLPLLQKRLETEAQKQLAEELLIPKLFVDCEIGLSIIDLKLYAQLKKFAPFGIGNPQPTFISRKVEVVSFQQVGTEGKHLKLRLKRNDPAVSQGRSLKENEFEAIAFNHGDLAFKLTPGQKIDILYNIEEDSWNGNHKLQLKVKDIKI